jgi:hypothetical protein
MAKKDKIDQDALLVQVLPTLDNSAVQAAVRKVDEGDPEVHDGIGFDSIMDLVNNGVKKWLIRDLLTLEDVAFEVLFERPLSQEALEWTGRGTIDFLATVKEGANGKPFEDFRGQRIGIDWKTTKGQLSTEWKNRYLDSWQWRIYCQASCAGIFSYRGLSRIGEVKEIFCKPAEDNKTTVDYQVLGLALQMQSLVNARLPIWPRNSPKACFAFGQECEFYTDCIDDSMPRTAIDKMPPMRYSTMEGFMSCNEKARRHLLNGGWAGSAETLFGKAVHRGLAELWRQAFELYEGKLD